MVNIIASMYDLFRKNLDNTSKKKDTRLLAIKGVATTLSSVVLGTSINEFDLKEIVKGEYYGKPAEVSYISLDQQNYGVMLGVLREECNKCDVASCCDTISVGGGYFFRTNLMFLVYRESCVPVVYLQDPVGWPYLKSRFNQDLVKNNVSSEKIDMLMDLGEKLSNIYFYVTNFGDYKMDNN
ncbi:hypothetical protein D6777_03025 [Candidatus Woesearchaeota archaeon]|nr:MAG: hypothetical protein D6777_03025 [Candidatus Woesearchaeota archaeon]